MAFAHSICNFYHFFEKSTQFHSIYFFTSLGIFNIQNLFHSMPWVCSTPPCVLIRQRIALLRAQDEKNLNESDIVQGPSILDEFHPIIVTLHSITPAQSRLAPQFVTLDSF